MVIPDANPRWTVRNLYVSGIQGSVSNLRVSLNITHPYRGDLQVMLTSPSGRTILLHNRQGGAADHVILSGRDLSSTFAGSNANGAWKVSVRDLARRDIGRLNSVSLSVTGR